MRRLIHKLTGHALVFVVALSGSGPVTSAAPTPMVDIGPTAFESTIPPSADEKVVQVAPFKLDTVPVTNADFLTFVRQYPEWRRDRASPLFVDAQYLSHWQDAETLMDDSQGQQPVTHVSWFAASAYCESRDARLPRWYEWEVAAAADADQPDARDDPLWRQQMLSWYSRPSNAPLPAVGESPANYYGVRDLYGLVWEWVEDYNGLLVGADNREQGGADVLQFCGAGALSMEQKEHYAVLMRVAMLSALEAKYTTRNLGFRCAKDIVETTP